MPQSTTELFGWTGLAGRPFAKRLGAAWATADACNAADTPKDPDPAERGSAVVEFTFLGLLLMVPVVYFVITVGQIQGGSFAVVGAADQAAKVFVAQPDEASGRAAAEQAAVVAIADYEHPADNDRAAISCDRQNCIADSFARTQNVHPAQ